MEDMATKSNFFQSLIESLFGGGDAEAIKKRQLKVIAKDLARTKNKFYKYSNNTADPSLAKFFYDIYKVISPAQAMLQTATPNALKNMILNSAMTEETSALLSGLSEQSLTQMAKTMPLKDVQTKVKNDLDQFLRSFDGATVKKIDMLYTRLMMFDTFCKFDFYFFLKKFDKTYKERDFDRPPHFQPVQGPYISEDLKNFIAAAWVLPFDNNWDLLFQTFKQMKGTEPVSPNNWRRVLAKLRPLRDKRIFESIIQLITENPMYSEKIRPEEYRIMDEYLQTVKRQVLDTLSTLKEEQTFGKIDTYLKAVFGSEDVKELNFYNDENNEAFTRKGFKGYLYCDPLRYLRQFMVEFTKKDLNTLSDILLVRGKWAEQQQCAPMSNSFHNLLQILGKIDEFDEKMSESGEYGLKLKNYLPRCDRERDAHSIISTILGDANDEAAELILEASKNFVVYARNLKLVIEDFAKVPRSVLIINWKDLDKFSEGHLKQMGVEAYKKIFNFVNLMQNFQISVNEKTSRR